jgi:hypothetical protein
MLTNYAAVWAPVGIGLAILAILWKLWAARALRRSGEAKKAADVDRI